MARESDLGQSLGLVAQLVVACVRESAMREGVQGGGWWCLCSRVRWWVKLNAGLGPGLGFGSKATECCTAGGRLVQ